MKLAALTIQNFGCFDSAGITVKIDNIVVLIGQNNIGKSSILDAYEAFASMGAELPLTAFKDEDPKNTISIEGIFTDITSSDIETIGNNCIYQDMEFGEAVKVKYVWLKPEEKGKKFTYDGIAGQYNQGGAGGWDTLLQSRIPAPLRIKPTDTPNELEKIITDILVSAIKQKIKSDNSHVTNLVEQVKSLTQQYADEINEEIENACSSINAKLQSVFPQHTITFVPDGKMEAEKILGAGSHIRIREASHPALPLRNQGSGLQRTFLWSAISALAEIGKYKTGKSKKELATDKPRILLIDEPESFLHPQVIRSAREALYQLAEVENWQVMASTHSPIFIDVSKEHTTIIRLEKDSCHSTKTISTDKVNFEEEERSRLAMIRSCHPTINEFFFADVVILVEGDTEHLVFTALIEKENLTKHYQVVNCLGKGNIQLFAKILNHFHLQYIAVHDSDSPKSLRKTGWAINGAWTTNQNILEITLSSPKNSFCIVQIPHFEGYYFDDELTKDKPFTAYQLIHSTGFQTSPAFEKLRSFVSHIDGGTHPGMYTSMAQLTTMVKEWVTEKNPEQKEMWDFTN